MIIRAPYGHNNSKKKNDSDKKAHIKWKIIEPISTLNKTQQDITVEIKRKMMTSRKTITVFTIGIVSLWMNNSQNDDIKTKHKWKTF